MSDYRDGYEAALEPKRKVVWKSRKAWATAIGALLVAVNVQAGSPISNDVMVAVIALIGLYVGTIAWQNVKLS